MRRRKRSCAASGTSCRRCSGRSVHHTTRGAPSHSSSTGRAPGSAPGRHAARPAKAASASAGAIHSRRTSSARSARLPGAAPGGTSAEARHSSRRRPDTPSRHSVRTMASRLYHASCGSTARVCTSCASVRPSGSAVCAGSCARSSSSGRRTRSSKNAASGTSARMASTRSVHSMRLGQPRPAGEQQRDQRRRHQAAAQVVGDLPARQRRDRGGRGREPAEELPVAADPAVAPRHVGGVARRRLLDHLHVRQQPGAGVAAFEQVVAEHPVGRQPLAERALEGVDVVDALADERALAEHVLVDVGDGARVGVDAGVAAVQPGVARAPARRQAGADARLQDAVALGHHVGAARVGGEARPVERVRHRRHELRRGVARQLRVGVERDDVAHVAEHAGVADDVREALARPGAGAAAQQRVEVAELAALPLLAHPHPVDGVPAPRPVEQEEGRSGLVVAVVVALRRVLRVERRDARGGVRHQFVVARHVLGGRVAEVGQQAEVQVRVAVGEEAHLERLDQLVDAGDAADERRHHDQRARAAGDAERVVHARQHARHDEQRRRPVDEAERELAGGQQQQQRERQRLPPAQVERRGDLGQQPGGEQHGEAGRRAAVDEQRPARDAAPPDGVQRQARPGGGLQRRAPAADEVVADVVQPLLVGRRRGAHRRRRPRGAPGGARRGGRRRQCHRVLRDLGLRCLRDARQRLDGVAVAVAGAEVHLRVDAGRVAAQRLLDGRQRLDEVAPVHRAEQAQAADAVGDRDLVGRLLLALGVDALLDGRAALAQALFEPGQRQRQRRALALQPARELGHEGARQRRLGARHVGDEEDELARRLLGRLQHAQRPLRGEVAVAEAGGDERADAAQVLDQRQPEHDGNRPQLAEPQRLHALVGGDEARQRAAREPAVAVRDHLQRQRVDARLAGLRGVRGRAGDGAAPAAGRVRLVGRRLRRRRLAEQARQLAAVALREVAPRGAHLLLDEIEVVEQPFGRRRHAPLGGGGGGELAVDADQHALVVGQPGEQPVGQRLVGDAVAGGQAAGMLRHLLGAVELGAQRLVAHRGARRLRLGSQPVEPALGGVREGRGDVGGGGRRTGHLEQALRFVGGKRSAGRTTRPATLPRHPAAPRPGCRAFVAVPAAAACCGAA